MPSTLTTASRAYAQLRGEILDGDLTAGTVLYEVEQSQRLGMSRTPVREAIHRLERDGLVAGTRRRGAVVTSVSSDDIAGVFEFRSCLESKAAELAATRGDSAVFAEFASKFRQAHERLSDPTLTESEIADYFALIRGFDDAMATASGNRFLNTALENLRTHAARVRRLARHSAARLAASALEHALIATAIANGEAALAVNATHVHLHNAHQYFSELWASRATADTTQATTKDDG